MTSAEFYFLVVLQNHFQVIYWRILISDWTLTQGIDNEF